MIVNINSRIVLALVALLPAPAFAGGFYIADVGTRGLGRAGALVAAPDDVLAAHYNPAGLSLLRGFHAQASLALVGMDLTFTRACPCLAGDQMTDARLSGEFTPARADTTLAIPFAGIAYGLPFMDLTLSFAWWGPTSGRHDWGELPEPSSRAFVESARGSAQRYSAIRAGNLELNYALSAAFMPLRGLRVGASVMSYQSGANQSQHLWANLASFASEAEDPRFDVPIRVEFQQNFALNWALGVSWSPIEGLAIGASYRAKRHIKSPGTVDVALPKDLVDAGARVVGNEIEVELSTAPIARAGIQYSLAGWGSVEAAAVVEFWSVHEKIVVTPQDIRLEVGASSQTLGPIELDRQWRDTISLRLGFELDRFAPWLGARAGWFFEPSAIAPERVDPARVDLDKHGFALGLATTWFGVTLEVAAMYVALVGETINGSAVGIKAPLEEPIGSPALRTTIGNGSYSGHYLITSASLSFELDAL